MRVVRRGVVREDRPVSTRAAAWVTIGLVAGLWFMIGLAGMGAWALYRIVNP